MTDATVGLPPGWVMATVADVGSVRLGRQRTPTKQTGRYPTRYLRAANITSDGLDLHDLLEMDFTPTERFTYNLQTDDIVLAEASGSATHVGRAAIWRNEIPGCCFQNTVIRFRPHLATPQYSMAVFRYYALSGVFARTARGTGILHLGGTRFKSIRFPLPPIEEQYRIAEEVDRRTAELRKVRLSLESALSNIEKQNKAIIVEAVNGTLVEPDATLAPREGRPFESAQDLLDRTVHVSENQFPFRPPPSVISGTSLTETTLPPGWMLCRIDEVGELALGRKREPRHQQGPYMRPYLRVKNVLEDYIDTTDILSMNFTPDEYQIYGLRWGDVLLNEGQSPDLVGRPAIYRDEVPEACFQNSLIRFRATPAVDPEFALLVFRYYLHAGIFKQAAKWTTNIAHLSLARLAELPFPLPPLREQERIAAEARRRLQASKVQELATRSSLDRLPDLEAEILDQAVQGRLIPQNPSDEPASDLIARLGPPVSPTILLSSDDLESDGEVEPVPASPVSASTSASLSEVLRSAARPLTLPELFALAGYDRDSTRDVEQFYLTLRDQLGQSIRALDIDGIDYLEATDATA